MKRVVLVVVVFIVWQASKARAVVIAYDDFNYAGVGNDLTGNGGGVGCATNWSGNTSFNIGDGSLTSPRDPLPKVGNSTTGVAYGENRDIDRQLVAPIGADNTKVYVSILMQPQGILHQGTYGGWFAFDMRGGTDVYMGMNYSRNNYGLRVEDIYKDSNVAAVVGQTVFLVMRIDFTEGVDPIYLYVNPTPGAPEPATPSASLINETIQQLTQIGITGPGALAVDAIRIGTTFLDVAPPVSDFNNDGVTNGADLGLLKTNFGSTSATHAMGDTDEDGDVDGRDFLVWQHQNGTVYPAAGAAVAPEPTAVILAGLATLALRPARRRLV